MADQIPLLIDQGATFEVDFLVTNANGIPIDVSSYTGIGKARKFVNSNTAVTMQINTFSNGIVRALLTAQQTNNMVYTDKYLYDIKLNTPSNTVVRIVEGFITISPQVSY